jgi:hypothetical protein
MLKTLRTRLVNALLVLAIVLGLAAMFGWILPRLWSLRSGPRISRTSDVLVQVQTLSQLITVKYVMEKVVLYEDPRWFGDSRVLMIVHANVLAGIDLKEIKPGDLTVSGKKISIKLPPVRAPIAFTAIDEKRTQVVERTTGLLRAFDKDMEQNARQQAVLDINLAAREAGILKDADERARSQLSNLFHLMGFEDVEFRQ